MSDKAMNIDHQASDLHGDYTHADADRDLNALYRSDREEQGTRLMRYILRLEAERDMWKAAFDGAVGHHEGKA